VLYCKATLIYLNYTAPGHICTWVLFETGRRNAPAPATLSLAPEKDCRRVPKAVADR